MEKTIKHGNTNIESPDSKDVKNLIDSIKGADEITKECSERLRSKKGNLDSNTLAKKYSKILKTFNGMLHSGMFQRDACYEWLMEKKNELENEYRVKSKTPITMDFIFLYPESITSFSEFDKDFDKKRDLGWTSIPECLGLLDAGLPKETADMYWYEWGRMTSLIRYPKCGSPVTPRDLPCWSFGKLESLIPEDDLLLCFRSAHGKDTWTFSGNGKVYHSHIEALVAVLVWSLKNKHITPEQLLEANRKR